MSKIYTRSGDAGSTGIGGGGRVDKDAPRIEAMGTIDELNSAIGMLLAHPLPESIQPMLEAVQHDLFDLGTELIVPDHPTLTAAFTTRLEEQLDLLNADLPPLKEFILPGGGVAAATCHQARTICRRAERRLVTLHREEPLRAELKSYVNRLSDLLFVIARVLARGSDVGEVLWQPGKNQNGNEG